ncbi:hypothetical protein JOD43_000735 [Pullulanibacillus pueri]|uniref:Uncharacterized protein n=1 Tax=Pullulanibacillus pueri TaxID=1437324 RepID=A0A8J2ZZP8_9BACL|nr:hypothetical protein [Pullulanibacillus pueri]MBM7680573.1 hypothetical protein [Pullulanibacillus pueri]GGH88716.1 hypothetical protein GCM10007096_41680 [Pullulanibacillus pueri]
MARKLFLWAFPFILIIILFGLHYLYTIQGELELPDKGWSRTLHKPINSTERTLYTYSDKQGTELYTIDGEAITHSTLDNNLKVTQQHSHSFKGDLIRLYWAKGDTYVFKKNLNLYYFNGQKELLIDKGVEDASYKEGTVYYSQGNMLKKVDLKTLKSEKVRQFPNDIRTLTIDKSYGALLLTTLKNKSDVAFYLSSLEGKTPQFKKFATTSVINGNIIKANYFVNKGKFHLFYMTTNVHGEIIYLPYYEVMSVQQLNAKKAKILKNNPIHFQGRPDLNTSEIYFSLIKNQPTVLLSAEGKRNLRDTALNVYEAQPSSDGSWVLERRSTSTEASIHPFWINNQTIGWLDLKSEDHYQLGLTNQDPRLIKDSLKLHSEDLKVALSVASLAIPRILILILISLLFASPALMIYGGIAFTKVELLERNSPVVKWIIGLVFVAMMYGFSFFVMKPSFYYYAPDYLTFPLGVIVWPAIMTVVSWLVTHRFKTAEWTLLQEVSYFSLLYLIIANFLFGPYYI